MFDFNDKFLIWVGCLDLEFFDNNYMNNIIVYYPNLYSPKYKKSELKD